MCLYLHMPEISCFFMPLYTIFHIVHHYVIIANALIVYLVVFKYKYNELRLNKKITNAQSKPVMRGK